MPHTPQEQLPQVLAIPFELMRAASGNPITVTVLEPDGTSREVCLRIPTASEMRDLVTAARAGLASEGLPPFPDDRQIAGLIRPLPV